MAHPRAAADRRDYRPANSCWTVPSLTATDTIHGRPSNSLVPTASAEERSVNTHPSTSPSATSAARTSDASAGGTGPKVRSTVRSPSTVSEPPSSTTSSTSSALAGMKCRNASSASTWGLCPQPAVHAATMDAAAVNSASRRRIADDLTAGARSRVRARRPCGSRRSLLPRPGAWLRTVMTAHADSSDPLVNVMDPGDAVLLGCFTVRRGGHSRACRFVTRSS